MKIRTIAAIGAGAALAYLGDPASGQERRRRVAALVGKAPAKSSPATSTLTISTSNPDLSAHLAS
jgi:hypothetical protein